MSEFKCDKYSKMYKEKGWKLDDVPCLMVSEEEGMIRMDQEEVEDVTAVYLSPDTARKLAIELTKIADKIEGFEYHSEWRGTMLCTSVIMPIHPLKDCTE